MRAKLLLFFHICKRARKYFTKSAFLCKKKLKQFSKKIILEDTINSQFEECFSKIFALNNNIDEDFDKDFFLDPKEKPDIKANLFSSEDIKDKTADKSKEKLCNNETGSKNFNESSSDEMEKSLYNYQNIFNNLMDKDMNSLNIIIQKNEKEETKKECENFLGKKRNLFKVD